MGGVCPCFAGVDPKAKPAANAEKPKAVAKALASGGAEKPAPAPAEKKAEPPPESKPQPPVAAAAAEKQPLLPGKAEEKPPQSVEPVTLPPKAAPAAPATTEPPAPTAAATTAPPPAPATVPLLQEAAPAPAPAEPPTQTEAPAPADALDPPDQVVIGVGSPLEVYSNSYGAWCPGVVHAHDSTSILVTYQVPGEPVEASISTKTLPLDSPELRAVQADGAWLTASVEVYSHSNQCWCLGKITEVSDGLLSVVFFYPNEPPDSVPVMKKLPFGDRDLRLRGVDTAFAPMQDEGASPTAEELEKAGVVEVYSASRQTWIVGEVKGVQEGMVTVSLRYPDMPEDSGPFEKVLPVGHLDIRLVADAAPVQA